MSVGVVPVGLTAIVALTTTVLAQVGTVDPSFSSSFAPLALKLQVDSKILAGGYAGLVRLNTNGGLDGTFNCNVSGEVWCIDTQPDGKIVFGGRFSSVDGVARTNVARINLNGDLDSGFVVGAIANFVFSVIAHPDGAVLIGGEFTHVGGVSRRGVARLNGNGSLDPFFNPGGGAEGVRSMVLQPDGKILIGGVFATVDGVPRTNVARLSPNGGLDTAFVPQGGANGPVISVALQPDGKVIIGGAFTAVDGVTNVGIARLHANGTVDTNFNSGSGASELIGGQPVWSVLCRQNGDVFLAGGFSKVNGLQRNGVAKLHSNGAVDTNFVPGLPSSSRAYAIAIQPDGNLLFGGTPLVRLVNFPPDTGPVTATIGMYAGITLDGTIGGRYRIEFATELNPTNWMFLKDVVLPQARICSSTWRLLGNRNVFTGSRRILEADFLAT